MPDIKEFVRACVRARARVCMCVCVCGVVAKGEVYGKSLTSSFYFDYFICWTRLCFENADSFTANSTFSSFRIIVLR